MAIFQVCVHAPAWMALDLAGQKIYYTDYVDNVVRRCNMDGTGLETLFSVGANHNPNGIALDLQAGKIY